MMDDCVVESDCVVEDVCKVEKEPLVENELEDFSESKVHWNETIAMNFKTYIIGGRTRGARGAMAPPDFWELKKLPINKILG